MFTKQVAYRFGQAQCVDQRLTNNVFSLNTGFIER